MKIDRIDIYRVNMPLLAPWKTAFGEDWVIESVFVRLKSGDRIGWGEAAPGLPTYSAESARGAFVTLRDFLAPQVVGKDVESGLVLQQAMSPVKDNRFAKAAIDLAWWDLHAKMRGEPLWKTLGGSGPAVDVGDDFGVQDSIDDLLALVGASLAKGFRRVKLKFRPGWDVDMVAAVRGAFPDATIHIDCNSAFTLDDVEMFQRLDRYNLAMIEQPLAHDDLIDHAALARQIDTPICLDESITSVDKARKALQIGSAKWINVKTGRVGGITNAVAIHDLCRDAGVGCWVGGMLESAVGGGHNLALASLDNFIYPADVFPSSRFYADDLAAPALELSGPSQITAPDAPGCGTEPVVERLAAMTQESACLKA